MTIIATLNVPATDVGYLLTTLLDTAAVQYPANKRIASIKLQWENNVAFLVPTPGSIVTTTGTTPDVYGFRLDTTTREFEEMNHPANLLSLDEYVLAADTANTKVHLFAYTV